MNECMNDVSGDYPQPELLPQLTNAYMSSNDKDRRKVPSLFDFQFQTATSLNPSSSSSATSSTTGLISDVAVRPPLLVPQTNRNNTHTVTHDSHFTGLWDKHPQESGMNVAR